MFREDFLEAVTVSFNQKDGWSRVGQETKQRMAQGKAEEQARVCDTLGRLSGTACRAWGGKVAGARSPRAL